MLSRAFPCGNRAICFVLILRVYTETSGAPMICRMSKIMLDNCNSHFLSIYFSRLVGHILMNINMIAIPPGFPLVFPCPGH